MPPDEKSQKRVEKLFSDLEQIAKQPLTDNDSGGVALEKKGTSPTAESHELNTLLLRIRELESQLKESEQRISPAKANAPAILYEKEEIGYAYSGDAVLPIQTAKVPEKNPESAIKTPLTASGETIGEIKVEAPEQRAWTAEEEGMASAVAQQVSLQIQNLRLLAATERARAEAQAANRQFTHQNWESFMDGIRNSERIGYMYDQSSVALFAESAPEQPDVQETINVLDEHIGNLFLKTDPTRPLTDQDREMISAVARQISQQVESLRLLAEASRARANAEEATRRLTRENWQSFTSQKADTLGYAYDSIQVTPFENTRIPQNISFEQPLSVRGETIGQLTVAGLNNISPEALDLANNIATQVSAHIENLRLAEQTQNTLIVTENLYAASRAITSTSNEVDTMKELVKYIDHTELDRIVVAVKVSDTPVTAHVVAVWDREGMEDRFLGNRFTDKQIPLVSTIQLNEAILINDFNDAPHVDPLTQKTFKMLGVSSAAILPIATSNELLGWILLETTHKPRQFTIEGIQPYLTLSGQVATVMQSLRLLEVNEKRARELETVAVVSTTASTTLDPDELLQSVVNLTKERFNLYHAHIYLADDSWNTLLLASGAGEIGKQMVIAGHAIPMNTEKSIVARTTRERTALIVSDVRTEPDYLPNPYLPDTRSEMAVPMVSGDKVIGVFDVQSAQVGYFSQEDANIYTTLALQVAVALQNARLYQEQSATVAQLRELDRLKSSFLANMSHELRTPLNSILGFADVMLEELDGPLTENMNNDLGLIYKNGQHLLHLINDVLDMAKIESGKMNLNIEKFNLQEIIEEVTSITAPLASEKNLALFIDADSDHEVEINADKIRLRQVMINLINNSIKFTEKGKIAIHVAREENNVLISVKDTGIGIPMELLESVFQEFTQVDTTTTRKVGGTGLGLPISRRLIQMHGGRLWAESTGKDGEGSTFYVFLPIEAKIEEEPKVK